MTDHKKTFDINDPRLTAYALGELHDPQDRAEVEAALEAQPELRAHVEQTRKAADLLAGAFGTETLPDASGLEPEEGGNGQKADGNREDAEAGSPRLIGLPGLGKGWALAMAASIVMALGVFTLLLTTKPYEGEDVAYDMAQPEAARIEEDLVQDRPMSSWEKRREAEQAIKEVEREFGWNQEEEPEEVAFQMAAPEPSSEEKRALAATERLRLDETPAALEFSMQQARSDPPKTLDYRSTVAEGATRVPAKIVDSPETVTLPITEAATDTSKIGSLADVFSYTSGVTEAPETPSSTPRRAGGKAKAATKQETVERQSFNELRRDLSAANLQTEMAFAPNKVVDIPLAIPVEPPPPPGPSREGYDAVMENPFKAVGQEPLSTFSIDVDTASYANVRRLLQQGQLPPAGAVRIEELVNYFRYDYAGPESRETPFAVHVDGAEAPWAPEHQLVRIGLQGYEIPWEERPPSNLVFLIDVSGSMSAINKLPLVQKSLRILTERLDERDRVAIVTYAGHSATALPSTTANNTDTILHAIDILHAGGFTHGSAGIADAYAIARKHFIDEGNNRVVLCTDGDFNVGTTSRSGLTELIEKEARDGVFLSVFGFGMGNYQDGMLEELTNKGNGNYGYIDSLREARKVFLEQATGTLMTIAKDVKIQVEFNPANVQAYRLIGYENRTLAKEDFNDDTKDAGEIGAGHSVTALYEIVPAGVEFQAGSVDPLKYQKPAAPEPETVEGLGDELLTVKLRYKQPDSDTSQLLSVPLKAGELTDAPDADFRFASAVAGFGMLLRGSEYVGEPQVFGWDEIRSLATGALGEDPGGHRIEFLDLVDAAQRLKPLPKQKENTEAEDSAEKQRE